MDPMSITNRHNNPLVKAPKTPERIQAENFEAVFLTQFIGEMMDSVDTGLTSGGYAEDTWKSVLSSEYAKSIAEQGNTGIASSIESQLKAYRGKE